MTPICIAGTALLSTLVALLYIPLMSAWLFTGAN